VLTKFWIFCFTSTNMYNKSGFKGSGLSIFWGMGHSWFKSWYILLLLLCSDTVVSGFTLFVVVFFFSPRGSFFFNSLETELLSLLKYVQVAQFCSSFVIWCMCWNDFSSSWQIQTAFYKISFVVVISYNFPSGETG
jgi:hypothetical protein